METLRSQFRWQNVAFPVNYNGSFALCRWQSSRRISGWFITYRLLLALLFICILLSSILTEDWILWYIYLTNIGYIGLTLHFIISAAVVIQHLLNDSYGIRNDERSLTLLTKISWVFYNLANPIAIAITATFWGALYDYSTPMKPQEFLFHAVNSIAVVLDLFVGARPFFLLHVYQPFCVMFCYCTFTVVYWAAGGVGAEGEHWIYPIIDWDDPGNTSLVVVLMFLMLIPLQGVMWGVHLLRDLIYRKFVKKFDCNVVGLVAENKTFEE